MAGRRALARIHKNIKISLNPANSGVTSLEVTRTSVIPFTVAVELSREDKDYSSSL
ncbi:MAG: hypothetical protein ACXVB9_12580 [Bdellovibrionota bacterium]